MVCDEDADIRPNRDGDHSLSVRAAEPGRWRLGLAYRSRQFCIRDGDELRGVEDFGEQRGGQSNGQSQGPIPPTGRRGERASLGEILVECFRSHGMGSREPGPPGIMARTA